YYTLIYNQDFHRWRAADQGEDTLVLRFSQPRWRWIFSGLVDRHPIKIRRGHRVRLRVALEGPWVSQMGSDRWMRAHPLLNRYTIAQYNEGVNGVARDSVWRLPRPRGDSLTQMWDVGLVPPFSGGCPTIGNWWCSPIGSQLVLVEVYDAGSGVRVDSSYGLIDTVGRVFFYRAPITDATTNSNADILHFCYCDTTSLKYLVIRTPNHLPLYTATLSLPARGMGSADSIDLTDPSYLQGVPGIHYTLLQDRSLVPPRMRAAAWAGNCADLYNSFVPGPHYDSGVVNAADLEFYLPRNGVTSGYSWADLDADGAVTAFDGLRLLLNQNALRRSAGP
ncbi:MAG: hypothetical protein N2170_09995, partial [Bacteroidia bacterium]|nr:hypothetical protein [Bacteroidia bacterium]